MVKSFLVSPRAQALVLLLLAALSLGAVLAFLSSADEPELPLHILTPSLVLQHQHAVHSLAFSPDGKTLGTAGGFRDLPGEIKLWDVLTSTERATPKGDQ